MRRGHRGSPRLDSSVLHRVVLSIGTEIGIKKKKKKKFSSLQVASLQVESVANSPADTNDILALASSDGYILGDGLLIGSVCKYQDFEKATNQSFRELLFMNV
jgi:hypothetical protein